MRESVKSTRVKDNSATQSVPTSSNVTPNISASQSNVEDFGLSKNNSVPSMLRNRQTSLHESFHAYLLEEAQLALAKAVKFLGGAMAIALRTCLEKDR